MNRTLEILKDLVAFDTQNPPRKIPSAELFAYIEKLLGDSFDYEHKDYGEGQHYLLAKRGSPEFLFNFHLDTVPVNPDWTLNPHELVLKDGKAYGLGSCDTKGAAACVLSILENSSSPAALLFSTDEEAGKSTVIGNFLKENHSYKGVIVSEPSRAKAILEHRGIESLKVLFKGESGHASQAENLLQSAVHQACIWGTLVLDVAEKLEQDNFKNLRGICFNLGCIEGGLKPNMIAADTEVRLGFRPLPSQNSEEIIDILAKTAPGLVKLEVVRGFSGPSLPLFGHEDSLNQSKALAESFGMEISEAVDFWTEASLFSQAGFPSIVFGPGDIKQAHTADEWLELEQLEKALAVYKGILQV